MLPPMLHKNAGEIREKITIHHFLEKEAWECLPGRSEVRCEGVAAFSPRGRFLAVGLADGRVGIWDFDTMCHLVFTLGLPEQLQSKIDKALEQGEGGGKAKLEYEVVGLSWGACARRLLVALKEDEADMYLCLWDIVTREVLRCTRITGTAGIPQLLSVEEGRQECVLCTSPTDVAVVELESGQVTPIELSGGEDDAVRKERAKATQPGACALLDGGRTLFCTLNRRVFRFEYLGQGKYRETQRGEQVPGTGNIDTLIVGADRAFLVAGTCRGASLIDGSSLAPLQSLGGQSAQVEWTDWTFGFGNKIVGVLNTNRSSSLGSIYVWTIVGGVAQGPDVRKIPQDGLSGVALSCGRPMLVGVSHGGTVFMLRETFTTTFPGAMYPKGYVVLENNVLYPEKEDELDKAVRRVKRGSEALRREPEPVTSNTGEAAAGAEAAASSTEGSEEEDVDIVGEGGEEDEEWKALRPAWAEEQDVAPFLEIRPLAEEAEEEAEEKEATGGIPGLLPLPRAVVTKRTDRQLVKAAMEAPEAGRNVICAALERVVKKGPGPGVRVIELPGGEQQQQQPSEKRQRTGDAPVASAGMVGPSSSSSLSSPPLMVVPSPVSFMPGLGGGMVPQVAPGLARPMMTGPPSFLNNFGPIV